MYLNKFFIDIKIFDIFIIIFKKIISYKNFTFFSKKKKFN